MTCTGDGGYLVTPSFTPGIGKVMARREVMRPSCSRHASITIAAMAKYEFSVSVEPRYLPDQSQPEHALYGFAYTVTVHNTGEVAAQLIARHWIIRDEEGREEQVKGLGVVGEQPLLQPGEGFQYTSGCRLRTPAGTMEGSYFCVAEDGARFDAPIPRFVLDADGPDVRTRVLH